MIEIVQIAREDTHIRAFDEIINMATEIEYKFLVDAKTWASVNKPNPKHILQGFISKNKDRFVRVRVIDEQGFLTIKGKSVGLARTEFEYEIPKKDAEELLDQFTDKYIEKLRYEIIYDGKTWEVDEFKGKLDGLILAELEVESEDEIFTRPNWVANDVSTDPSYFNAVLIDKC